MPRAGLRPLRYLHDRFVQHLSVSLSAFLRNGTEVQLETIEQLSSRRFLQGLPDPTAIFMVDSTVGGALALVIDNELALVLVDRLLGGPGGKPTLERALTEIEQSVLEDLVEIVLMGLKQVWSPTLDVTLSIRKVETRPALVTLEPPEEGRVVLKLAVSFSEAEGIHGSMQIVLPVAIADKLSSELARDFGHARETMSVAASDLREVESRLLRIPVDLTVELTAKEVTAGDLVRLKPGHVLNLGRSLDEPALVNVGRAPKFEGVLAKSNGRPVIEVKDVLDAD